MEALSRTETEEIKVYIALIAALLVGLRWLWHRFAEPRANLFAQWSDRSFKVLLACLALWSCLNYSRYHPTYVWAERVDAYDLCHYYLNAKYFEELGYHGLYPAIILADNETGGPYFDSHHPLYQRQDVETGEYYFQVYDEFVADTEEHSEIRATFGSERWSEFKHDFTYLQREVVGFTPSTWEQMLWDHGFNGAPSWVLFAQPLANMTPVESVKLLCWTDALWLMAAVMATWWAFGGSASLWLTIFLFTTYSGRWPSFTWAFGRYDYVALLIIATCLLKKGQESKSGLVTGIATAFRVFPAVWLFGPAVKGVFGLVGDLRTRLSWKPENTARVNPPPPPQEPPPWLSPPQLRLLKLAGAFLAIQLLLWGAVSARYGPATLHRHFENLFEHTTVENLSSMRQGWTLTAAYTPEQAAEGAAFAWCAMSKGEKNCPRPSFNNRMNMERRQHIKRQEPWRKKVGIALVILLGLGLRRARDHEAFALGVVPFFLMATASYYYYIVRSTLVIMHAGDLKRVRNAVGLGFLFLIEAVVHWLQIVVPKWRVIQIGSMGWLLMAYCVLMIVWFNWEAWRGDRSST